MATEMRIYVGTYAKYNNGSIEGEWLDLGNYADKAAFEEACKELHSDEEDPEFMFQDWEGIPSAFISECSVDEAVWEIMEAFNEYNEGAVLAFIDWQGEWNADTFQECFITETSDLAGWVEEFLEETGSLENVPDNLRYYIDFEKYARDMDLNGDIYHDGEYLFWNR